jgi:cytochrome c biogenesis protein
MSPEQLKKLACCFTATSKNPINQSAESIKKILTEQGWKNPQTSSVTDTLRVSVQRGTWTRLAVYLVHASVLVILAGALIGTFFGFQGYIFLPEGRSSDRVFYQKDGEPLLLDFQFFCDHAEKKFYPDGMVSEYRADMRVQDSQRGVSFDKSVIVNDPLSYRGINFYLGDFFPIDEFLVVISNHTDNTEQAFRVGPQMDIVWPESVVIARLEDFTRAADNEILLARVNLSADPQEEPAEVWVRNNNTARIDHAGQEFSVSVSQLTTVLFLVNKDPGVWVVWTGFILLCIGLYICFFMSHRRVWVCLSTTAKGTRAVVGGSSNKNKPGFEKVFNKLAEQIKREF